MVGQDHGGGSRGNGQDRGCTCGKGILRHGICSFIQLLRYSVAIRELGEHHDNRINEIIMSEPAIHLKLVSFKFYGQDKLFPDFLE